MKYSIKVNEVRAKEGSNIKGFATVVFGDSFKITNIAILPMAVCYSAVKRFGGNPVLGMVIGAIMLWL